MGNTSQIKRILIVLFIYPLVFILVILILRFGIDFFINQKRIGNSEFYLTYQVDSNHPILIRKLSFFESQELWESSACVFYVYWDESYILFPVYSTSYDIESYNLIRYDNAKIELFKTLPKDSAVYYHLIDSLHIRLDQMKLKTLGCHNISIYDDLKLCK